MSPWIDEPQPGAPRPITDGQVEDVVVHTLESTARASGSRPADERDGTSTVPAGGLRDAGRYSELTKPVRDRAGDRGGGRTRIYRPGRPGARAGDEAAPAARGASAIRWSILPSAGWWSSTDRARAASPRSGWASTPSDATRRSGSRSTAGRWLRAGGPGPPDPRPARERGRRRRRARGAAEARRRPDAAARGERKHRQALGQRLREPPRRHAGQRPGRAHRSRP